MRATLLLVFLFAALRLSAAESLFVTAGGVAFPARLITGAAVATVTGELVVGGLGETADPAWAGKIVLLDRGVVSFLQKVQNAKSAGAVGVIVANNVPGFDTATLGPGNTSTLPAVSITKTDGTALKERAGAVVRLGAPAPPVVLPSPVGHKGELLGSDGEKWIFVKMPPVVIGGEGSETIAAGGRFVFGVTAEGTPPLSYQWSKDGQAIPGADGTTHTIDSVKPADAGSYVCRVTNAAGFAVSNTLRLVVQ